MSSNRIVCFILAVCVCLSTTIIASQIDPSIAFAATTDKSLSKRLKKAQGAYDELEIETAQSVLKKAIKGANKDDFESPLLADVYIMLGIVEYAATGEEAPVVDAFEKAVSLNRDVKIPDVYVTPVFEKILKKTIADLPGVEPDKGDPVSVDGFTHTPLQTADAGKPLEFEAFVPADMAVYKMFLNYRRFDEKTFTQVEMQPSDATRFSVTIDGGEVTTSQIDYFIGAVDRGDNIIANSGDKLNPFNLVVLGSGSVKTDPKDLDPELPGSPSRKLVYFVLGAGTGLGVLTGGDSNMPTANPGRNVQAGIAPAFGHANIEGGYNINEKMQIGLAFRIQFAPTQSFAGLEGGPSLDPGSGFWDTKVPCFGLNAGVDCLMSLRYKYYFSNNKSSKIFTSLGAGVGRVRNWLQLKQEVSSATDPGPLCEGKEINTDADGRKFCFIRDTVRTGWAHFGVGGGIAFPLNDWLDIGLDGFLMVLAPETSINLDVNAGLIVNF